MATCKVLVWGDEKVGKFSLINRIVSDTWDENNTKLFKECQYRKHVIFEDMEHCEDTTQTLNIIVDILDLGRAGCNDEHSQINCNFIRECDGLFLIPYRSN